jgi:hypothetical protein
VVERGRGARWHVLQQRDRQQPKEPVFAECVPGRLGDPPLLLGDVTVTPQQLADVVSRRDEVGGDRVAHQLISPSPPVGMVRFCD